MKITDRPSSNQLQRRQPLLRSAAGSCCALAAAAFGLLGSQVPAQAYSDNFNSYSSAADMTAAGWINSSLNPALVTSSFPTVAPGNKALRMQANPVPETYPAVNMWYRMADYTNFCMAVDILNWPAPTSTNNVALILFGHMTDGASGGIVSDQNPAYAQGVICNYDANQAGGTPTDRTGGELQINIVYPGFTTVTMAACEMTFVPGRPYRIIFSGTSAHYVAQAYDWNDLTTPLVTIQADDTVSGYDHGACGLLGASRDGGNTTPVDITFDNYYADVTNPNLATPPALSHPIPGTPVLATRSPSARWKNFLNPASGISFTANTYSANVVNASATKLSLNGVDFSSHLVVSANGTSISGSLPGSVLDTNKLYSAELVVTDVAGTQSSTNTFWFDTFSDAYLLSSSVKTIESEEYNYAAGTYQPDPIVVSGIDTNGVQVNGFGVGYYDLVGTAGIDYSNHSATADSSFDDFRPQDAVRTLNGGANGIEDAISAVWLPASDNIRSQHAASNLLEYVVCRTEVPAGTNQTYEWMNYTRTFIPGFYVAYLRYSSWGATSNELHKVASDPTQPAQTTTKLGTFQIPNNIRYANYLYTPLVNNAGTQPLLNLTGATTLRHVITGTPIKDNRLIMLNYIMLVNTPVSVYSSATVNGTYTLEASASPNYDNGTITMPAPSAARFYRLSAAVPLKIRGISVSGGNLILALLH